MKPGRCGWLLAACLIGGCGSLSAPPRDMFYRLSVAPAADEAADPAGKAVVVVPPFGASGLHGERALIYAHDDGTTLEQYSFDHWIDSPRHLLQQALVDTLNRAPGLFAVRTSGAEPTYTVHGQIIRFERDVQAGGDRAVVSLQFDAHRSGQRFPLLSRRYDETMTLSGDSTRAAAAAIDQATLALLARFVADFSAARSAHDGAR